MAFETADRKRFWEKKILVWEGGRYAFDNAHLPLMERLADRASDSLRFRLQFAGELLHDHVAGKNVADIGCGSGLLADALFAAAAAHYRGVDIAESAITAARKRAHDADWGDAASFEVGTVLELDDLDDADVVVSLGLTDWLTDDELHRLHALGGQAHFLHAISERRATPAQWLHRAYCWASYGWRNGGYVPRYYDVAWYADLARQHREGDVYVVRHPRLSFGAILTSLPVGEKVP